MSDTFSNPGNRASRSSTERDARAADRRFDLRSVVVRYEARPDRCTIYPRRERCCEHVDAWLSADADAFVPLEEMR